ncbi:unnamed protein product [Calypogeia fissa]
MTTVKKNGSRSMDENLTPADEAAKVAQLREALGPLSSRAAIFCTDDCLHRFLRARNFNVKKSEKMLRECLKWRASYKPEEIKWEDVAKEAETGKVYRASFSDKWGGTVIIMRPGNQNTSDQGGQIKHLVHNLENAIINLPPGQEQMVWLVDFKGWTVRKSVPIGTVREVAYVLQTMYPERLKVAVLYDPPRIFEGFWTLVKPFLDPKTFKKVKFVYTSKPESVKVVDELFDLDELEVPFGGRNPKLYNHQDYANQMKLDDAKTAAYWKLDEPDVSSIKVDTQGKDPRKENHVKDTSIAAAPEAAQTA